MVREVSLVVILCPLPTTTLFSSIAFQLEVQSLREYPFDLPKMLDGCLKTVDGYDTDFDEVEDV